MRTSRGLWALSGLLAGLAGLAVSHVAAMWLTNREAPLYAVADGIIRLTPGPIVRFAIDQLGTRNKPLLLTGIVVVLMILFLVAGAQARRHWLRSVLVFSVLAAVAAAAVLAQPGGGPFDLVPVALALMTWLVGVAVLTGPLVDLPAPVEAVAPTEGDVGTGVVDGPRAGHARRAFLFRAGMVALVATSGTLLANVVSRGRRRVEEARRLLRLPLTQPVVDPRWRVEDPPEGATGWLTPNNDFYRIHTAVVAPTVDAAEWRLRIHGLVDQEVELSLNDLLALDVVEEWITLNCVSNPIGGPLIGNARWTGVRTADVLALAGVHPDADAVLQTSHEGWNCGTPLRVLTDERNSLLAFGMNGQPLPIDHGYPVRTITPGLYGYVSACKWVVDWEVTRFADFTAYWTHRGWAERGPVKMASRIDAPRDGQAVAAGRVRVGGMAWFQHTGLAAVEVQLDSGAWTRTELAEVPSADTWVQWATTLDLEPGDHLLRVRAIAESGEVQTSVAAEVAPDGATGHHVIQFSAREEV
ncbi:molybdopterin-dependent oxidoreductase [Nocardioides limicola]|uniref:molybdopterin-dependent oxidoreductase n=1 Tax=Nocardioides limicola TaxID=2803368 RepID=UPI0027DDC128|nr:molybdopterin-dependent oxidoreductase [Nocardioides sp. DJM-14]